jgi:hypothetical protein
LKREELDILDKICYFRISTILNKNMMNLLYHKNKNCCDDNIGAIAVQLGVVDLLKELELKPKGIWTNSFNKLVHAYLNQVLTLKETLQQAIIEIEKETNNNLEVIRSVSKDEMEIIPKNSILLDLSDRDMVLANNPDLFIQILGRYFIFFHSTFVTAKLL